MALLIRGGRIVTATDEYEADIYCAGESIARIEGSIDPGSVPDAEVIEAAGKFVFPGFVDPHVHVHLPFMGTQAKDDWESVSKAALVGGTTTLIEMICPSKGEEPYEAFELWRGKAAGKAACDYSFHMGVSRFDDNTRESGGRTVEEQLRAVVAEGIASFKIFLAYKGAFGVSDEELFKTLSLAKELGVIVTAHCENADLIDALQKKLLAEGKTGPEWHEPSRPPRVEGEGVNHLMSFAELTGAHVYVVHTSCREGLRAAERAKGRGVRAWVETVAPYLVLDSSYAEQGDFEGAKFVMSPPIRAKQHQGKLWNALREGLVSTVATDHAPFDFAGQKEMGRGDFTKIPNGIPSVEHRVDLLYTHGVKTGRIDLHRFVDCLSTQPARIFGLEKKGGIAVGMDADLVVYDGNYEGTISAATHHMQTDYSAYEGWAIGGHPSVVTVRGAVAVREGEFVGTPGFAPGYGRMIERSPTH